MNLKKIDPKPENMIHGRQYLVIADPHSDEYAPAWRLCTWWAFEESPAELEWDRGSYGLGEVGDIYEVPELE